MKYKYLLLLSAILIILSCNDNKARQPQNEAQATEFQFRDVAVNLDTPWEILWGPDNWIWMTERGGRISRVDPENGTVQVLFTINDVFEDGERGLMGMVLHPNFQQTPHVFVVHNYESGNETPIKIVRFTYDGSKLTSPTTIKDGIPGFWNHDGSRLWIDEQLVLWVTMGDRAQAQTAQDLSSLNGKILRMKLDGSPASGNISEGSYVYSYGHRNPQGFVIVNGRVYSSEHGPDTDDELNLITKGGNYGWPAVKGYCDTPAEQQYCEANNAIEPLLSIRPSGTYAVAGIDYYNHNLIPEWKNSILITSLKSGILVQAKLNDAGDKVVEDFDLFAQQWGRLRDICISPDGRVFISTSNRDGRGSPRSQDDRIIEIKPQTTSSEEGDSGGNGIFPNPASERVAFTLTSEVNGLKVFDCYGNLVNSFNPAGSFEWSPEYSNGEKAPAGIYMVQFLFKDRILSKKLLLVK